MTTVALTEAQTKFIVRLLSQQSAINAQIDTVVLTIAAGADIEAWGGDPQLNTDTRTLTFAPPQEAKDAQ